MNEQEFNEIMIDDSKFDEFIAALDSETTLPTPVFLKNYIQALLDQAWEKENAISGKNYSSTAFGVLTKRFDKGDELLAHFSMQDMKKVYQFSSQMLMERLIFGELKNSEFETAQRELVQLYERVTGENRALIVPYLLLGQLQAVKNWITLENDEPVITNAIEPEAQKTEAELRSSSRLYVVASESTDERQDVVYFVQNPTSKKIKIGFSNIFPQRLRALECGAGETLDVMILLSGRYDLESELHEKFKQYRLKGEWFSPGEEILQFIESKKTKIGQSESQMLGLIG